MTIEEALADIISKGYKPEVGELYFNSDVVLNTKFGSTAINSLYFENDTVIYSNSSLGKEEYIPRNILSVHHDKTKELLNAFNSREFLILDIANSVLAELRHQPLEEEEYTIRDNLITFKNVVFQGPNNFTFQSLSIKDGEIFLHSPNCLEEIKYDH